MERVDAGSWSWGGQGQGSVRVDEDAPGGVVVIDGVFVDRPRIGAGTLAGAGFERAVRLLV